MKKNVYWITITLILIGGLGWCMVNKASASTIHESAAGNPAMGGGRGRGGFGNGRNIQNPQNLGGSFLQTPSDPSTLSNEEAAGLVFMREEEKLAHDVYITLFEVWDQPIFQNIANSELTHTQAIQSLLQSYGLQDPALDLAGSFNNPDLQALYNELIARGSQSLVEALKVGAAIEEIDILDLQQRLDQTDNGNIQQVYANLLAGSYNHLQAFSRMLQAQTGETYLPQHLSAEDFQAILGETVPNGQGNGYRGGRP